jgi:hypothetical protein
MRPLQDVIEQHLLSLSQVVEDLRALAAREASNPRSPLFKERLEHHLRQLSEEMLSFRVDVDAWRRSVPDVSWNDPPSLL